MVPNAQESPIGRHKTYDRDDVAKRAMYVFWERGYEATTIQQLEERLQINRYSIFAEFGSKEGLFEASLRAYESSVVDAALAELEAPKANVEDVVVFLERFRDSDTQALPGCLLCNTAVERAPNSASAQDQVLRYFERLRAAFAHALRTRIDAHAISAALVSAVVGAFVQMRGGLGSGERDQIVDGLILWIRQG